MQVKKSRVKINIGVDILRTSIMLITTDVTDRNGAIEMTEYYRDVPANFNSFFKSLVDGSYTGENFVNPINELTETGG